MEVCIRIRDVVTVIIMYYSVLFKYSREGLLLLLLLLLQEQVEEKEIGENIVVFY